MGIFRSLKHRNFRLYFLGQLISVFGTFMQAMAVSWFAWRLTGSTKWLGAIGLAAQLPILLLGLFAGVASERISRHKLVIAVQFVAMIQAAVLAAFTYSGIITPWLLFFLTLFMGCIFAFDYPSRQAFLMDLVGLEDVSNAVALNSSTVHTSRVLGPVFAGFIIGRWGEATCFAINAVSFLAVIIALIMMKKSEFHPQTMGKNGSISESIAEVIKYLWSKRELRQVVLLLCILSLTVMPFISLLPKLVADHFGDSPDILGFVMGAAGLGSLIGAIYLASKKETKTLPRKVRFGFLIAPLAMIVFVWTRQMSIALPFLVVFGISSFLSIAGTNTTLQISTLPQFRGRIMSIFTVMFFGMVPVGSLILGYLSALIGVETTMTLGSIITILSAIFVLKQFYSSKIQNS